MKAKYWSNGVEDKAEIKTRKIKLAQMMPSSIPTAN